ncbi:hypothetical protein [Streptomyces gilvosporeus]|uniref:hypothetical protein n=1 Tax=Streptomyces gilvosporeus TaxID=553510 RepID=UPI000D1A3DF8|nr:hypothetical protein [Streptomyces gilvosporeus]
MRDAISRGRSADAGGVRGVRGLLLVALLALLQAALLAGLCHLPSSRTGHCHLDAPAAVSGMSTGHCVSDGSEMASAGSGKRHHPGSGAGRISQASGCHSRPHTPTGPGGKAIGAASLASAAEATGDGSPHAVRTSAPGALSGRTAVLRC